MPSSVTSKAGLAGVATTAVAMLVVGAMNVDSPDSRDVAEVERLANYSLVVAGDVEQAPAAKQWFYYPQGSGGR
jgi:hypothetical protein